MKQLTYILRLSLTLLIITGVMAAALAGVNAITEEKIAAITAEKTQTAIEAVVPGVVKAESISFHDNTGLVSTVYRIETSVNHSIAASYYDYAVEVAPSGFDGEITMMVGVTKEGKVLGISIISHTETAGLGAVAAANTAKGEAFRQQFAGAEGTLAVSKYGGTIDALTGATITSRAVTEGVNAAIACVQNWAEGG